MVKKQFHFGNWELWSCILKLSTFPASALNGKDKNDGPMGYGNKGFFQSYLLYKGNMESRALYFSIFHVVPSVKRILDVAISLEI